MKLLTLFFFVDVLEHLYDPTIALKEIRRVLKSGGYLCFKTPNCANLKNRVKLMFGKSPLHNIDGWLFNDRYYTPSGETKFRGIYANILWKKSRKF